MPLSSPYGERKRQQNGSNEVNRRVELEFARGVPWFEDRLVGSDTRLELWALPNSMDCSAASSAHSQDLQFVCADAVKKFGHVLLV